MERIGLISWFSGQNDEAQLLDWDPNGFVCVSDWVDGTSS